eukprot:362156-Chlamydomonas_euryale.AAC.27
MDAKTGTGQHVTVTSLDPSTLRAAADRQCLNERGCQQQQTSTAYINNTPCVTATAHVHDQPSGSTYPSTHGNSPHVRQTTAALTQRRPASTPRTLSIGSLCLRA